MAPPKQRRQARVIEIRSAGKNHQVVTVRAPKPQNACREHMATPCATCPWRVDAVGVFPAKAFRHSARTAYDMSRNTFACHLAGTKYPKQCAGFLLRGADHNLSVRLGKMAGAYGAVTDGGHKLHANYRAMAIANGVSADDPVLDPCRD